MNAKEPKGFFEIPSIKKLIREEIGKGKKKKAKEIKNKDWSVYIV